MCFGTFGSIKVTSCSWDAITFAQLKSALYLRLRSLQGNNFAKFRGPQGTPVVAE